MIEVGALRALCSVAALNVTSRDRSRSRLKRASPPFCSGNRGPADGRCSYAEQVALRADIDGM